MNQSPVSAANTNGLHWFEAASFHLESEYPGVWEEQLAAFQSGLFDNARMQLLTSATRIEPGDPESGSEAGLYAHIEELLPLLIPESTDLPVALYRSHQPEAPFTQLVFVPGELHLVINAQSDAQKHLLDKHARQFLAVEVGAFARMSVDQGRTAVARLVLTSLLTQTSQDEVVRRSIQNFHRSLAIWCDQHVARTLEDAPLHRAFLFDLYRSEIENPGITEGTIIKDLSTITSSQDPGSIPASGSRILAATTNLSGEMIDQSSDALCDSPFLQPPLQLSGIDLLQRRDLGLLTIQFLDEFLKPSWLQTPLIRSWRGEFRVGSNDLTPGTGIPWPEVLSDELRTYFCSLLLDAATFDPEISEAALAASFLFAESRGLSESLRQMVSNDLKLGKRARQKIEDNASSIVEAAGGLAT